MRFSISVHNASAEMLSMKVSAKLEKNVGIVTSESKARWEYNPTKKVLEKENTNHIVVLCLYKYLDQFGPSSFPVNLRKKMQHPRGRI